MKGENKKAMEGKWFDDNVPCFLFGVAFPLKISTAPNESPVQIDMSNISQKDRWLTTKAFALTQQILKCQMIVKVRPPSLLPDADPNF